MLGQVLKWVDLLLILPIIVAIIGLILTDINLLGVRPRFLRILGPQVYTIPCSSTLPRFYHLQSLSKHDQIYLEIMLFVILTYYYLSQIHISYYSLFLLAKHCLSAVESCELACIPISSFFLNRFLLSFTV